MSGNIPAARLALIEGVAARARKLLGKDAPAYLAPFIRAYYHGVAEQEMAERPAEDLARIALAHLSSARVRRPGEALVRVFNPDAKRDGFTTSRTLILVSVDDMPFLLDSLTMVCTQAGMTVWFVAHPVLAVARDQRGRIRSVGESDGSDAPQESWQLIEVDRETRPDALDALRERLLEALDDVRRATTDWMAMRRRAREIAAELESAPPPTAAANEIAEIRALLDWMDDNHFTFLGYREYRLRRGRSRDVLEPLARTGLGLLRTGRRGRTSSSTTLEGEIRRFARSPEQPLIITKANTLSTVHRATHLDYVGVKRFDARGRVVGERRFIGLWTSSAYSRSPRDIPVLRHKVRQVVAHYGLAPSSHDGKAVMHVLDVYPRDELFQASVPELIDTVRGIVNLYERAQVRLFARRDAFRRFYSCLLYVPRDRYDTSVRHRIEALVREAMGGLSIESQVQLSESVLARVHMLVRTDPDQRRRVDLPTLERRIAFEVRTWTDRFQQALAESRDESGAAAVFKRFAQAFPAAYQEDMTPESAVADVEHLQTLAVEPSGLVMSLYRAAGQPDHKMQFKIYRRDQPIPISDVLPTIENLGLKLISERPYELEFDERSWWIQDFELEHPRSVSIDLASDGPRFRDTFAKVWMGQADNDGFNRLVLASDLTWREVVVLRTYARWFGQLGLPLSQAYMEEALASNPQAAAALVRLFMSRFDPALSPRARAAAEKRHVAALDTLLAAIERVDDDRIVRAFRTAILGTLRTTFFQVDGHGAPREYLAIKLDPRSIAETPLPRPMFEIFMHSPRVEAVHLRMGKVARGGLRWSDRREDFRTEVLGLMKAQNVKNSVIVPVGAKGGFVPRRLPAAREEMLREGTECYRLFIRAMLDLTDNLVDGKVVPPVNVVRADPDDPYLVVAADKGTASFSDVANAIAVEYGFWLGDAFASGGSAGYDHKKMGITARGAWECVKRHFRELGVDIQSQDFTVAGIGDMGGDVFGNGMLLSRHIRLLAAFNHQHIFLDPDPDAEQSHAERARLFALPRSGWDDYDRKLISRGGGVFLRSSKSIPLSSQARQMLGIDAASAAPREIMRAILKMPVDLLWNGGIGTYVKASDESNAEAGDRSNDAVRVDGRELRCRVVGEGGNLGMTQRARTEFALAGGRLNTDFIDNAGGVNCSDVEVNIKILLSAAMRRGSLRRKDRDRLLARMTPEVAALVLRGNYLQSQAISVTEAHAAERISEHAHVIRSLERIGGLDRALEALPNDDELAERRRQGRGLTRPELAMVLSYSKLWLYDRLIESDVPEDPYLKGEVVRYFPAAIQKRFARDITRHPLRREIIVTATTNSLVNRMGPVFAIRAQQDTGSDLGSIARAYSIAREITDMRALWTAIEDLDNRVPAALQTEMNYRTSRLLRYLTYWVLSSLRDDLDIERAVSRFRPGVKELLSELPSLLSGLEAERYQRELQKLEADGAPHGLARRVASLGAAQSAVDIVAVAGVRPTPVTRAANVYFSVGAATGLDWLRNGIDQLPVDGHWQAIARGTLREEAYALQRRLTSKVLAGDERGEPARAVAAWLDGRGREAEGLRRTLHDMRTAGNPDFPTLSVALQSVRRLAAA